MKKLSLFLLLFLPSLVLADNTVHFRGDQVITSTITTTLPELYIATDTYTLGYSSANKFYGDGSNLTGILTNSNWEQHLSTWSTIGIQISTSVYIAGITSSTIYYGSGGELTDIDHNLDLDSLQGGDTGALTNSDDVPFTTPGNYTYNASSITVTGGVAKLAVTGTGSASWPLTTSSSYTYAATSITVTGGVAKLLHTDTTVYAHWHLNEATGSSAADSSGNGRTGTAVNMENGDWQAGKLNNCLVFGGTDEYIDCQDIADFERTDAFSLECWFKTSNGATQDLLARRDNAGALAGYAIQMSATGEVWVVLCNNNGGGNRLIVYTNNSGFNNNAWHHLIVTYDGSSSPSGINIYIDNSLEGIFTFADGLSASITASSDFMIGARAGADKFYIGSIDEVIIYDKEISTTTVAYRYNSSSGREDTVDSDLYFTTNPPIYNDFGHVFTSSISAFIETSNVSGSDDIKYHISIDDGSTWEYWTGAIWATTDDSYTQANTDADVNTNIEDLGYTGTFRWRALLHSDDGSTTPELDKIQINVGVGYSTGSYVVEMNNDIQPTNNYDYLTLTETSVKPTDTTIEYQYSTNSGSIWNGSWLSSATLITALQALSPVGDGTDTLLLKVQLTTADSNETPEIDNINIISDAGTGTAYMYHLSSTPYLNLTDATAQLEALHTDGHPTFSSITITNIANSTCTYAQNSDLLDGHDTDYFLAASSATSTYLTQSSATITYDPSTYISSTYLTQSSATATYDPSSYITSTYLAQSSATATYLQLSSATITYDPSDYISNTYLTQSSATATYWNLDTALLTESSATATYLQGFDIEEDGAIKSTNVGLIDFIDYFDVNSVAQVVLDTTTLQTTVLRREYDVYIATYARVGADIVCDGTDDDTDFETARDLAGINGTIGIFPGTYLFDTDGVTLSTAGQQWIALGNVILTASGLSAYENMMHISATRVFISGFEFQGGNTNITGAGTVSGGTFWTIQHCLFKEFGAGDAGRAVDIEAGAGDGLLFNCSFEDNQNNLATVGSRGERCTYFALHFDANETGISNSYYYNSFIGIAMSAHDGWYFKDSGNANTWSNLSLACDAANVGGGIIISGDQGIYDNISIYRTRSAHGMDIQSTAQSVIISNSLFRNTAEQSGAPGTYHGINISGDNVSIAGCTFTGTYDEDVIEVDSSADGTTINNNQMTNLTGINEYIDDNGTNTSAQGNIPVQENFDISIDSQAATGKPNLVPTHTGTRVVTDADYKYYISTGIVNNAQWQEIGRNVSYAHGYATDVAVTVTASTEAFHIINPTWVANVPAKGFTISGASATYTGAGPKVFKLTGAFSAESDTVATVVYWALFKNGAICASTIIDRKIATAGDVGAMSLTTLLELSTGDILSIRLSGDKSAVITNRFVEFDIIQVN